MTETAHVDLQNFNTGDYEPLTLPTRKNVTVPNISERDMNTESRG